MLARITTAVVALALSTPLFAADTWEADPGHSTIAFRVLHAGVSPFYGLINGPTGTIVIDSEDASKSSVNIEAKIANIYTANPDRDTHLKNDEFFNAMQHPTVSFKSTAVKKVDDKTFEVTGDLTMHGVTKSMTVKLHKLGENDKIPQLGHVAGFETTFTIKRSDFKFGSKFGPEALGEEITLMVGIEGKKK